MIPQSLVSRNRNILIFYLTTIAISCFFITTNWIYFWTRIVTYGQLGFIDAVGFAFGMLIEIPSGAVADLIGKRKTIIAGFLAGAIGVAIITYSSSFAALFIGWLITQICYSFYSGAAEALVYDSLVEDKEEHKFDRIITIGSQLQSYTAAISTFIGGIIYLYNFRLPHILWGLSYFVGIFISLKFVEPRIDTEKFSLKSYVHQLGTGFRELWQVELRQFIGFFFVLIGIAFMYSWGFLRPAIATSFGFYAREQAVILPLLTISLAYLTRYVPVLAQRFSGMQGLTILSLFMALGFYLASLPLGYYGIVAMILIGIAGRVAYPWISIIVNKKIASKYRATTLSTIALFAKLPYVILGVTAGQMLEQGRLDTFNRSIALGIILIVLLTIIINRLHTRKAAII